MFNLKQIRENIILTSGYMYNTVDYIDVHSFEYFLMFYNKKKANKIHAITCRKSEFDC